MQTAIRSAFHALAIALLCASAPHSPTSSAASLDTLSLKAEALFRLANPCPATGVSNGPCKGYVIDRIIPVICGGGEEPANMQWQTLAEAREKDKWERIGCRRGRVMYRPERPVVIEAFPLNDAAPVKATPLTAGHQSPHGNAPPTDAKPIEPDR